MAQQQSYDEFMAEQAAKKKKASDDAKAAAAKAVPAATATPAPAKSSADTAREAQVGMGGFEGDQARKMKGITEATGAANAQERASEAGTYGGLSIGERGQADRMVRSGEAKSRDEAAGIIKKRKTPPAAKQAEALK